MVSALGSFSALFVATFILLTGNGLLSTLLSTRMALAGFSNTTAGFVLSCYFTGLLTGSFVCYRLVQRVGHIRAFTVFAGTATAAALLHGLYLNPWFWAMLRFISGIMTFGLFVVIESWLNECAEAHSRGRVFSIYMILSYLGIGIGQYLLNAGNIRGNELFILTGIMFALCLVPVSATEGVHPNLPERKAFGFFAIFRKAPLAMMGSLAAGMTNSAFYSMTPLVCANIGLAIHQLSWIMSITVFCGLAAQVAVGTLSDRFDRTVVLTVIATVLATFSGFMFVSAKISFVDMVVKMGLFGALSFAVYPVSVARAHDIFGGKDAVAVSTGLLFAFSIGASVSPLLASGMMTLVDSPFGLYVFWCMVNGALAATAFYLKKREKVDIVPVADQVAFVPMKSSTPLVIALDPRNESQGDSNQVDPSGGPAR